VASWLYGLFPRLSADKTFWQRGNILPAHINRNVQLISGMLFPNAVFDSSILQYLRETESRRSEILMAFAPVTAGTSFRQAVAEARPWL
jgi:hypothetical protein